MKFLLEICTGSLDDAIAAQEGGAQRIELNSNLFQGGLTPTLGTLIEARTALKIPIMCMIRPRGGGFCYGPADQKVMHRDAELSLQRGADGLVFGFLNSRGAIDRPAVRKFMKIVGKADSVFHRAIDVTPDPLVALDQLVDLGVTRVMTSGQEDSVYEGCDTIRRMIDHAAGRIEILPGGGINPFNLKDVLVRTGCTQLHMALMTTTRDTSCNGRPQVFFGGQLRPPEDVVTVTDTAQVRRMRRMLGN